VKCLNIDDYKKLTRRVVKYLDSTADMLFILSSDGDGILRWWVDASYAVHNNMKGYTGKILSIGSGSVYITSTKQKLVT
jgi:hypothetical protein